MSKFIKSIGRCYVNNIGFDLYENKDKSATIRPLKLGHQFPKKYWFKFDSLILAEEFIDNINLHGASLVQHLKEVLL
jgi:hypothetical protein